MKLLKVEPKENETLLTFSAHPDEMEVLMQFSVNFLIAAGLSSVEEDEDDISDMEQLELFPEGTKH